MERRCGSDRAATWVCGLAAVAVAGCTPPMTTAPPVARWHGAPVCRVQGHTGRGTGTSDWEYQLAADGKPIAIRTEWEAGLEQELFFHDDRGTLVARAWHHVPADPPPRGIIYGGPRAAGTRYRHDGKARRTRVESVRFYAPLEPASTEPSVWPRGAVQDWTHYQYDADHLVAIEWGTSEDPRVEAWRLVYDGPRLVQLRHEVDGRASFLHDYHYDPAGRLASEVSILVDSGYSTTYQFRYDPAGRLIGRDTADATGKVRLEYDAAGRATRYIDGAFETLYAYDGAGRIARIEHLAKDPVNQSTSEFTYSGGCTAEIAAGLAPDPVSGVRYELWDEKLWVVFHPEWEGDPPRF